MSLIDFEGFNDGQAANGKGWVLSGSVNVTDNTNQRTGDACMRRQSGTSTYAIPGSLQHADIGVGFAQKTDPLDTGSNYVALRMTDDVGGQTDFKFRIDGVIEIHKADGTILSSLGTYVGNHYDFWEVRCKLGASSTGILQIYRNGNHSSPVYSNTAVTTLFSGATKFVSWAIVGSNHNGYYDDTYCFNNDGSGVTAFLGDCRAYPIYPSGAGSHSDFTGASTDVDEPGPSPSMSDKLTSSTVNQISQFAMQDLPYGAADVYAMKATLYADKADALSTRVCRVAGKVGSDFVGSVDQTLSTSPQAFYETFASKPGGGSWALSDVNAMELGVKITV